MTVLVVGATGSVGHLVVDVAVGKGHAVRALVRDARKAGGLTSDAAIVVGDLTRRDTLATAVDGVDAIVFAHGSYGDTTEAQRVDYGAVHNVLTVLRNRPVRIALMTAIGVTDRRTGAHDWKRRGERLVRMSGMPYTIVRPGWFDYNKPDEQRLVALQGDRRQAGNPSDGVVARRQIAEVLVASLISDGALRKTFELVATHGPAQQDLEGLFAALDPDPADALDAVHDIANMPLAQEPQQVRNELHAVQTLTSGQLHVSHLEGDHR
jgi:uncharacterized protein YbjT (DUF2867 family)